jgi:hypothetical protein
MRNDLSNSSLVQLSVLNSATESMLRESVMQELNFRAH